MTPQEIELMLEKFKKLEEKLDDMNQEINELKEVWTKAQGMWIIVKLIGGIGGIIFTVVYWVKDHVRL